MSQKREERAMAWFLQLLLLFTIVASAQPDVIFLKRKIIDTRRTPIELVRSDRIQRDARGNEVARQYLIQFKDYATQEDKETVRSRLQTSFEHYVPHNTYVVLVRPSLLSSVLANDQRVSWFGPVKPEYKTLLPLGQRKDGTWDSNVPAQGVNEKSGSNDGTTVGGKSGSNDGTTVNEKSGPNDGTAVNEKSGTPLHGKSESNAGTGKSGLPCISKFTFHVQLLSATSMELAAQSVIQAIRSINSQLQKMAQFDAHGRHMSITVCIEDISSVLSVLSEHEHVHWIEPKMPMALSNIAATSIIQEGPNVAEFQGPIDPSVSTGNPSDSSAGKSGCSSTGKPGYPSAGNSDYPSAGSLRHSIWEHGIRGQGEIVACGDTGIDHDMCLFHDSQYGPINQFNTVIPSHRKIRGYYQVQVRDPLTGIVVGKTDTKDEVNGHGTHVAGSIAGSIASRHQQTNNFIRDTHTSDTNGNDTTLDMFSGAAPDAKLCFIDLHSPAVGLAIPTDLYSQYFTIGYECGARIHSNSWGCNVAGLFTCVYDCQCTWALDIPALGAKKGEPVYDSYCQESFGVPRCCEYCNQYNNYASDVDRFLYEHDDDVILFAAGNSGHLSRTGTITSPATAKNAIAVGASHTTFLNFLNSIDYTDYAAILDALGLKSLDECCAPSSKYQTLCCPDKIREIMMDPAERRYFSPEQLAYFSSRGPTADGRLKPELVAPGYNLLSAHSDGKIDSFQCSYPMAPKLGNEAALMSSRGTSMATPIAAGAAALVRQYIRERLNETNPSGPLVRALLVHSAQPMDGQVRLSGRPTDSMSLSSLRYPNSFNGYGLIQLNKVLLFPDNVTTTSGTFSTGISTGISTGTSTGTSGTSGTSSTGTPSFRLEHVNRATLTPSANHAYVFYQREEEVRSATGTNNNNLFRVTLSWYDPPASPMSDSSRTLINDLHLDVYLSAHKVQQLDDQLSSPSSSWIRYTGNSGSQTPEQNDNNLDYDRTNTLEQVTLRNHSFAQRVVLVVVRAPSTIQGKSTQDYAIVVTHPVLMKRLSPVNVTIPPRFEPSWWSKLTVWLASLSLSFWLTCMLCCTSGISVLSCVGLVVARKFHIHLQRQSQESHHPLSEEDLATTVPAHNVGEQQHPDTTYYR